MNQCTPRQANLLAGFGYDPNQFDFDSASALIDALKANNWNPLPGGPPKAPQQPSQVRYGAPRPAGDGDGPNRPCTPRQAAFVRARGYDPSGMTFQLASAFIEQMIKQPPAPPQAPPAAFPPPSAASPQPCSPPQPPVPPFPQTYPNSPPQGDFPWS